MLELENNFTFAVRGSGTEPKVKFYIFANRMVKNASELANMKAELKSDIDSLAIEIESDARHRAES